MDNTKLIVNSIFCRFIQKQPCRPENCFLINLQRKLNITQGHSSKRSKGLQATIGPFPLFRSEMHYLQNNDFQLFLYGLAMHEFSFGTVVNQRSQESVQGLSKPFDNFTWIFLLVTAFLFIIYLKMHCRKVTAVLFFFSLLDQNPNIEPKNILSSPITVKMLCSIWLFLSMILNNAYKEKMYQFLTIATFPHTAKSINDISQFPFPVFTSVSYGSENSTESLIRIYIQELANDVQHGYLNLTNLEAYIKLNRSMKYSRELKLHEVLVPLLNETKFSLTNETKGEFVLVDLKSCISILNNLVNVFSKKHFKPGGDIPIFSTTIWWLTDRYYLINLVTPYLKGFVEFGLQSRWDKFKQIQIHYWEIMKVLKLWGGKSRGKVLIRLLNGVSRFKKMKKNEPMPMTVNLFAVFAKPVFYALMMSVFAFVFELYRSQFSVFYAWIHGSCNLPRWIPFNTVLKL